MLKISFHPACQPEKEYVLRYIFEERLGFEVALNPDPGQKGIHLSGTISGELVSRDYFPIHLEATDLRALGKQINHCFFGVNDFWEDGICPFTISFLYLSGWTDQKVKNRDQHGRVPMKSSLACIAGTISYPAVDVCILLIRQKLKSMGYEGPFKESEYKLNISHDVDLPFLWLNTKRSIRHLGYLALKAGKPVRAAREGVCWMKHVTGAVDDPYDTFDFLMDEAERVDERATFNFMAATRSKFNEGYDLNHPKLQKLIQNIKDRGHRIGFHPGYETEKNSKLWREEKERLESVLGMEIRTGRQHFLKFTSPDTWRIWDQNGMQTDGSIGFAESPGFRAGTSHSYPNYDIEARKALKIREQPLICMDSSFFVYADQSKSEFLENLEDIIRACRTHGGTFTLLWHNSSFAFQKPGLGKELYSTIIDMARK